MNACHFFSGDGEKWSAHTRYVRTDTKGERGMDADRDMPLLPQLGVYIGLALWCTAGYNQRA